ncbi:nSTAND1 domain-containing NTPase [Rhodococcus zopfii]|uniref:nSTAND1 domain-containing NTPase n=1 Tax=Rhodococcus zopfii TaxID=43772 RepID=UPI00111111E9|nr:TIR domain-containing protein [Rhodococcus zopfii]
MTRIFLSHSSRDSRQAIALKRWLVQQEPGFAGEIFLDIDPDTGIAPGVRWREALTRANARCEAVVCLLSTSWESSRECNDEYSLAETLNKPIFCARLDAMAGGRTHEWQHCDLFGDGPTTEILVDGTPVVFRTEGLRRLLRGLRDAGVGAEHFAWPPPGEPDRAPYRGWDPLEEQDAAIFFGRDTEIVGALDTLRGMRAAGTASLFVILGPSGTGKSSFLRAGLLPRLRRDDRHFAPLGVVRPERAALDGDRGLARAIHTARTGLGLPGPPLGEIESACRGADVARLRGWLEEVREVARARLLDHSADTPRPTLILPVDQAEELFSADAGQQAARFLELVPRLADHDGNGEPPLIVVATIRSDRYEALQTARALADVRTVPFAELKPLPRTEFKEVIRGPAQRSTEAGRPLTIEPALVDRLLSACGQGADTLPLLALTLARLYQDYGSTGRLTLDEYTATGGMHSVVQTEIDALLSPDPEERRVQLEHLRAAFIPWLATVEPDTGQPLRRIARWSDLPADGRPLTDAMVARRLLVKYEREGEVVVEVALESLLRQWRDLADWLRVASDDLKTADTLERTAAAWVRSDRDDAWLLSGSRLAEAEVLSVQDQFRDRLRSSHSFLLASRRHEEDQVTAERQRLEDELRAAQEMRDALETHAAALCARSSVLRKVLAATTVVALVAVVGCVWAIVAEREAGTLAREAVAAGLVSDAQSVLAGAEPDGEVRALHQTLAAPHLDPETNDAMAATLVERRDVLEVLDTPANVLSAAFSPDGRWIVSGGSDELVRLWDAHTGMPVGDPMAGHEGDVMRVAFSPDSTRIASGGADGTVRFWDTTTRRSLVTPESPSDPSPVLSLAFRPDGSRILAGSMDGTARWWDPKTGEPVDEATYLEWGPMTAAAFSPDNRLLAASGSQDHTIRVWNADTAERVIEPMPGHTAPVESLSFSTDGSELLSGSDDGTIRRWSVSDGKPSGEVMSGHRGPVTSVAYGPGERVIVSGTLDGSLQVWDAATSRILTNQVTGHQSGVTQVAFSPDGSRILSASRDHTLRLWDARTVVPLTGHEAWTLGVRLSPDNREVVSTGEDGIRRWDATTGAPVGTPVIVRDAPVRAAAVDPEGRMAVTGGDDGVLHRWDLLSGAPLGSPMTGHVWSVTVAEFSPDGRMIVSGGADGTVRRWDATTGAEIGTAITAHDGGVESVDFSPDGRTIVSGGADNMLRRWDAATGAQVGEPLTGHTGWVWADFSPDGSTVLSASDDGTVRLWDSATGAQIGATMDVGHNGMLFAEFSPDGHMLVSYGTDGILRLWDPTSGAPIGPPMAGHNGWVADVVFSPDSRRVVSAGIDGTLRLWNAQTGAPVGGPMQGHQGPVFTVTFSPDGRRVVSGGFDHTVRFWSVPPADRDQWAPALCAKLNHDMSPGQWSEWVSREDPYEDICPDLEAAPEEPGGN